MESRAKLLGHPIHPMLIVFPLGLLATAVLFDLIGGFTGIAGFTIGSFWMIAAGVIGGLLAAIFGFWDWLHIPAGTRAKTVGLYHGLGNVLIVILFAVSWWLRRPDPVAPSTAAFTLSLVGALLAVVTGWLGGELVYRLDIGVDDGANPNAQSSLAGPATERAEGYPGGRAAGTR